MTRHFDAKVSRSPYDEDMLDKTAQVFIEVKKCIKIYESLWCGERWLQRRKQKFKVFEVEYIGLKWTYACVNLLSSKNNF